jgi:hypothetical protein
LLNNLTYSSAPDLPTAARQSAAPATESPITVEPPQPNQVYIDFLTQTRFWVQRVLSPIVIVVGVIGNGLTIVVMTRKRMRSSTNCYLAALASVDMAYLLFTFALSLKHYPGWRHPRYSAYWHSLPVLMMMADACTNISVWLTATFTLERFVVVSHPIRGKVICTESRARKTCAFIFTFCLLFVLPTPFEWSIVEQVEQSVSADSSGNSSIERTYLTMYPSEFGQNQTYKSVYYWLTAVLFIFIPVLTLSIFNAFLIRSVRNSRRQRTQMTQSKYTPASSRVARPLSTDNRNRSPNISHPGPRSCNSSSQSLDNNNKAHHPNNNNNHNNTNNIGVQLATNCSSRSSSPGDTSTSRGAASAPAPNRVEQQSAKQETKITVMLISVVFLFLICQLPVACSLIYTSIRELDSSRNEFYIVTTINNIINLMVAVNAAGNFVLYCLLSQKYRRTLFALICPCFKGRLTRLIGQNMTQTVVYSTSAHSQRQTNGLVSSRRRPPSEPTSRPTFKAPSTHDDSLFVREHRLDASKLQLGPYSTGEPISSSLEGASIADFEASNENVFSIPVPTLFSNETKSDSAPKSAT